jgi:RNA polymerase-binding protein DksA
MTENSKKIDESRLALYKDKLVKEKATLLKELEEIGKGNLKVLQSEASGETAYDEHLADSGTYTFERERDLSLENNIRDILAKIEVALEKLDKHTYGVCDRCGNLIDPARLKALPYANLCISCKKEEEKIG